MKDINILIDFMNNELDDKKSLLIKDKLSVIDGSEYLELMKIDSMLDEYVGNIQVPNDITHRVLNGSKKVNKHERNRKSQGFITVFTSFINNTAINYFSTMFNVILLVSTVAIPFNDIVKDNTTSTNPPIISIDNQEIENKKIAGADEHETKVTYIHTKQEFSNNLTEINEKPDELLTINKNISQIPELYTIEFNQLTEPIFPKISEITNPNSKFIYEFRTNLHSFFGKESTQQYNDAMLLNYSISLWYNLSPELNIGAEFRQEPYLMDNKSALLEKNMTSWEASIRYYPETTILYSTPYLQVNLGGGKYGMTGRVAGGLRYFIDEKLQVIGGLELGCLLYQNGKSININPKAGFNLGFSIGL